jgi:mRNA-degrading endonuclease RelE of RelBE toxin-antitoxin system
LVSDLQKPKLQIENCKLKVSRRFPRAVGLALENQFFKEEIRQLTCGKYRLLFEVDGETVRVLHVQ